RAKRAYELVLTQTPGDKVTALTFLRLGFCYYHLKNYNKSLENYNKSLALNPPPGQRSVLMSRMARVHSLTNDHTNAFIMIDSLIKKGFILLNDLDTAADYENIRKDKLFRDYYKKAYATMFTCSTNPKNREFDFWIGEWDVYQTGSASPVIGRSVIQNASGECMILENWTSLFITDVGKSMNFYDSRSGKWEQVWMRSDGHVQHFINGEYRDSAMRFTFEPNLPDGKKGMGRFIFFNEGNNKVRQFQEQSADDGKTWQTVYDFTYVRRISKN
nr:tetratricopeptide repeat protein [Chitinophagaceae bacterium]